MGYPGNNCIISGFALYLHETELMNVNPEEYSNKVNTQVFFSTCNRFILPSRL